MYPDEFTHRLSPADYTIEDEVQKAVAPQKSPAHLLLIENIPAQVDNESSSHAIPDHQQFEFIPPQHQALEEEQQQQEEEEEEEEAKGEEEDDGEEEDEGYYSEQPSR